MIIPDFLLREAGYRGQRIIEPFEERQIQNGMSYGLSCAGYDVQTKQGIRLAPGAFGLLSTVQKFAMPTDILGIVHDKSTWARRGLAVQNTVIEPGWCGYLTVEVTNHNNRDIVIQPGDPIAQIIFHRLEAPAERPYTGKYMNQEDKPVRAKVEGE